MCYYSYIYFGNCQHFELTLTAYCDKASVHPQVADDIISPPSPGTSSDDRSSGPPSDSRGNTTSSQKPSTKTTDQGANQERGSNTPQTHSNMSTMSPSAAASAKSWAQVAGDLAEKELPGVALIPRSVHPDVDLHTSFSQSPAGEYQHPDITSSPPTATLDRSIHTKLSINIPLDASSAFSMELTTQDENSPRVATHPKAGSIHPGDKSLPGSQHTISRRTGKGKPKLADLQSGEDEPAEPEGARMPIPARWKTQGPSLATAQRAMQRESRKNPSTFLTKNAISAVDSDLTAHPGKIASQTSIKSPAGSPARGSPGRNPTSHLTVSPTRPAWGSIHNVDGSGASHATFAKGSRAPSTVSSTGGYVTARQSPVSESQYSDLSYHTAPCELEGDISEIDLANDGNEQMAKRSDGMKNPHARGKSEPKAISTKPSVPRLSLRIPHPGTIPTADRKSPFTASSSPSGSPATTPSSRIPRISSSTKGDQESSETTLTRRSGRKMIADQATVTEDSEGMHTDELVIARPVPVPQTPALRHVRTLNDEGATPILSVGSPPAITHDDTCISVVSEESEPLDGDYVTVSPTDVPPAEDDLGKTAMVESYIEETRSATALAFPTGTIIEKPEDVPPVQRQASRSASMSSEATAKAVPLPRDPILALATGTNIEKSEDAPPVQRQASRSASVTSEATAKAVVLPRDPVLGDPSIVYSRRKSDVAVTDISPEPPVDEGSSINNTASTEIENPNTEHHAPSSGQSHYPELGQTSSLRAEAAAFVPQIAIPDRASLPFEWTTRLPQPGEEGVPQTVYPVQMPLDWPKDAPPPMACVPQLPMPVWDTNAPPATFNPYAPSVFGNPMYHLLYPVQAGAVPGFDFRAFVNGSPGKKGKKGKWSTSPKRGRKNRSEPISGSPTKLPSSEATGARMSKEADDKDEQGGDTTPKPSKATVAITESTGSSTFESLGLSEEHTGETPFAQQLEEIPDGPTGRASRTFDWGSIRNVPDRSQYQTEDPQPTFQAPRGPRENRPHDHEQRSWATGSNSIEIGQTGLGRPAMVLPYHEQTRQLGLDRRGYRRRYQSDPPGNGLYENQRPGRGGYGSYRNRGWNLGAGVPLDATAPFPNPVAPPGPRRANAAGASLDEGMASLGLGSRASGGGTFSLERGPGRTALVSELNPGSAQMDTGAANAVANSVASSTATSSQTVIRVPKEQKTEKRICGPCGDMIIEDALEWDGQTCNTCDMRRAEREGLPHP